MEALGVVTRNVVEAGKELDANGITNRRSTTSVITWGMSEVLAFGTAVKRVEQQALAPGRG